MKKAVNADWTKTHPAAAAMFKKMSFSTGQIGAMAALVDEDGIRDLVRSRGLGDVYKRQPRDRRALRCDMGEGDDGKPVSYTHLTLPTNREV